MQPPPRKGAYIKVCKNLHSEQVAKLQAKNQQECDILEDIRNFTKQRSAIEKSYGEALCKISANYQNRKIPCVPDIRLEDGSDAWNVYSVWRTVLDETEKLGKARLAAVEVFQQQISEDAKQTRQTKITLGKRLIDQLQLLQKDVQLQVQELDRCKKSYYDEEHVAHDARDKAAAAEEKLKRKKGSIFQSISSLQKNSAKFSARRDACDEKSAGARNDYLISLSSTNAHQKRYYEIEFERILRTMENETYDKVAEYLTLMSRTELLTCSASQSSYTKIKEQAQTITRGYNLRCYLTFYPMLGTNLQYELEPCEGDKIDRITVHDESTQTILEAESKKCVAAVQKEMKTIRECNRKIQKLQSNQKPDPDQNIDSEMKIEDLKMMIRRCEINKDKAEAKLEILREGGIEVEDYTKSVDSDSLGVDLDTSLSRSGSSLSVREEHRSRSTLSLHSEHRSRSSLSIHSEAATGEAEAGEQENATSSIAANAAQSSLDTEEAPEISAEEEARRQESLTWDPINVDWGEDPVSPLPPVTNGPPEDQGTYPKCIVLYNYTAQNPDELSILENEELELLAEGDGDGWVQARNYKGEVGYVPQNYIEMEEGAATTFPTQDYTTTAATIDTNVVGTEAPLNSAGLANDTEGYPTMQYNIEEEVVAPVSFSSIDYSFEATEDYDVGGSEPPPDMPPPPPPVVVSSPPKDDHVPVMNLPLSADPASFAEYCLALYDYEATCHEELTFNEGQIIKVLSKKVHDVDDGWWEGEVDGQVGLFPSLVVEECRHDGEPLTPDVFTFQDGSGASPCTTPPPHTPPEVPGFLLPPEKVIITQPTPEAEARDEEDPSSATTPTQANGNVTYTYDPPNFELELSREQQGKYHRQFSSSPDSDTEKDPQYGELVSSPDVSNQELPEEEKVEYDMDDTLEEDKETEEEAESVEKEEETENMEEEEEEQLQEEQQLEERAYEEIDDEDDLRTADDVDGAANAEVDDGPETEPEVVENVEDEDSGARPVEDSDVWDPSSVAEETVVNSDAFENQDPPNMEGSPPQFPDDSWVASFDEEPFSPQPPHCSYTEEQEDQDSSTKTGPSGTDQKPWDQPSNLGVAQIIITAATPMVESNEDEITATGEEDSRVEADQELAEVQPEAERAECEGEAVILDKAAAAAAAASAAPAPATGAQATTAASGTTAAAGVDGKAAGEAPAGKVPKKTLSEDKEEKRSEESPSDETSDQSPTPKSPSPSEGPIELDPEKLKTLERIKESNA